MAQLPPKIPPHMTQNWPSSYPHQRLPPPMSHMNLQSAAAPTAHSQPSWVDEFLDFSSARRGSHRRSTSDSITFLEAPILMDQEDDHHHHHNHNNNNHHTNGGFDRLDDDQLMSMFSDDMAMNAPPAMTAVSSPNNSSTPSDQNSNNDDQIKPHLLGQQPQQALKNEPGEVESSCDPNDPHAPPPPCSATSSGDTVIDPKRVKRILANRQSAQRSRVRKLQYISELERSVTSLQTEVSALSPRVAFLDHQRLILNVDNSALKQRIAALAQDKIFKDAHQEALKKEIERLRQIYHQQSIKKMGENNCATEAAATNGPMQQPQQPPADAMAGPEK